MSDQGKNRDPLADRFESGQPDYEISEANRRKSEVRLKYREISADDAIDSAEKHRRMSALYNDISTELNSLRNVLEHRRKDAYQQHIRQGNTEAIARFEQFFADEEEQARFHRYFEAPPPPNDGEE